VKETVDAVSVVSEVGLPARVQEALGALVGRLSGWS
jgi:hypothetical protein